MVFIINERQGSYHSGRNHQGEENRDLVPGRPSNFILNHYVLLSASGGAGTALSERTISPSPPNNNTSITKVLNKEVG